MWRLCAPSCLEQRVCCTALKVHSADLGLGVDTHKVQVFPAHLHQTVQVPVVVGAHRAVVGQPVDDIKLLQAAQPTRNSIYDEAGGMVGASLGAVNNSSGRTCYSCMHPTAEP